MPGPKRGADASANFGAEYRWLEGVTVGAYYMYGDAVGFNVVVSGNPLHPVAPQDLGAGPLPVNPRAPDAPRGTAWTTNTAALDQLAAGQAPDNWIDPDALPRTDRLLLKEAFKTIAWLQRLLEDRFQTNLVS